MNNLIRKLRKLKKFILQILAVTTDNASNNITFLQEVSSELIKDNIKFDNINQHVRCLAHVINLAAQQILITLKAAVIRNEEDLLNESNEQLRKEVGEVGGLLHKVTDFLFFYLILIYY